jgi:hypothetical protein
VIGDVCSPFPIESAWERNVSGPVGASDAQERYGGERLPDWDCAAPVISMPFGDSNLYQKRTKGHLVLSSEHRAMPPSAPVGLKPVATDAETPIWKSSRNSGMESAAVSRRKCSTISPGAWR